MYGTHDTRTKTQRLRRQHSLILEREHAREHLAVACYAWDMEAAEEATLRLVRTEKALRSNSARRCVARSR